MKENKKILTFFLALILVVIVIIFLGGYAGEIAEKSEQETINEFCSNENFTELCVCEEECPFPLFNKTKYQECIDDFGSYYHIKDCSKYRKKTNLEKIRTLDCKGLNQELNYIKTMSSFYQESKYRYDLEVLSRALNCTRIN